MHEAKTNRTEMTNSQLQPEISKTLSQQLTEHVDRKSVKDVKAFNNTISHLDKTDI